jgi:Domain of unknown function (DUF3854)
MTQNSNTTPNDIQSLRVDDAHLAELLASSIDKQIIALNFESLDNEQAAEALLYDQVSRRNDGRVSDKYTKYQNMGEGWWCAGIDLSTGETMTWGCFKPDQPRTRIDKAKDKPIKYEHPPSTPTEYFALRVSFSLGLKIARRYGLEATYTKRQDDAHSEAEDKCFWQWAIEQKQIDLVLTEGAKKAACLLSHGYLAIAVPGIWMVCQKTEDFEEEHTLKAGLRGIVQERDITIVFDQDEKPQTREAVTGATNRAVKACKSAGAVDCYRVKWELKDLPHKGVDDLIAACGINAFDHLMIKRLGGETAKKTASDQVLDIARTAIYFHTADKVAYANIQIEGNRHTYSVRSRAFRLWLTGESFKSTGKGISSQVMQDTLSTLEAIAIFQGETHEVNLRVAEHQGKIYLDLGTPEWKAIEVDALGWRIVSEPPVMFWRPESLLALPYPLEGGSLEELRNLINVGGSSWTLIVTFLLFSFCPNKTYPVLSISAHRGSGKTAAAEIIKGLIDPGKAPLIKPQGDTRNLAVTAARRWMVVYDNVSYISAEQSDDFCRLATGFGYSTRTLNTTEEETTFEMTRPQIITAIDALITRDDLADRVLMVQLPEISEDKRLPQSELNVKVEESRPRILGALLTALSQTLAELPNTKPDKLPRMADYALFAMAAEKAIGLESGEFRTTFDQAREESRQIVIEASPIGGAIIRMMESYSATGTWKGTASELLEVLRKYTDEATAHSKYWPKAPNVLARQLTRLTPDLKALGILIAFTPSNGTKFYSINRKVSTLSTLNDVNPISQAKKYSVDYFKNSVDSVDNPCFSVDYFSVDTLASVDNGADKKETTDTGQMVAQREFEVFSVDSVDKKAPLSDIRTVETDIIFDEV